MTDETAERLELKIAYLERANTELSDVLYRQQQELEALRLQVASLASRVEGLKVESEPYSTDQERPPHY